MTGTVPGQLQRFHGFFFLRDFYTAYDVPGTKVAEQLMDFCFGCQLGSSNTAFPARRTFTSLNGLDSRGLYFWRYHDGSGSAHVSSSSSLGYSE